MQCKAGNALEKGVYAVGKAVGTATQQVVDGVIYSASNTPFAGGPIITYFFDDVSDL